MFQSENIQNNMSSKLMEKDFKKKAKQFGYIGRPFINGKISKPYKKYALKNSNAPLPKGKVRFNKKIVNRSSLLTKKFKKVKKSVIRTFKQNKASKTIQKLSDPKLDISKEKFNDKFATKDFKIKVKKQNNTQTNRKILKSLYKQTKTFQSNSSRFIFEGVNNKPFSTPFTDFKKYNTFEEFEEFMNEKLNNTFYNHYNVGEGELKSSNITLQTNFIPIGNGCVKLPEWLKSNKKGFFPILNDDGLCGQRALAVSLKNKDGIKNLRKTSRKKQLDKIAKEMCEKLGIFTGMKFVDFEIFAKKFKRQVYIVSGRQDTLHHTDDYREEQYKNDESKIVFIYYDRLIEHYHLITNINSVISTPTQRNKYCIPCKRAYNINSYKTHKCMGSKCFCCQSYEPHSKSKKWLNCEICNRWCVNEECLKKHKEHFHTYKKCNKKNGIVKGDIKDATDWKCKECKLVMPIERHREEKHICGECKCDNCEEYAVDKNHRCNVLKGKITKSSCGENESYYAFDFESMFDDRDYHIVNYINVRQLYTSNRWSFKTLDEFIDFTREKQKATFIAHNFKGYDGWLIHNHLKLTFGKKPKKIVLAGQKIMFMAFDNVRFIDSLNFIQSGLDALPKTFGLDQKIFKKGYFPYKLNIEEFQNYKGKFPKKKWFETNKMKVSTNHKIGIECNDKAKCKYCDFNRWYETQKHITNYDFQKELEEYCISDVDILCKSMEVFRDEMMIICDGLDPLKCITIASYAMKVYLTLHAPTEKELDGQQLDEEEKDKIKQTGISILSREEYIKIKRGFHGGRTEVFKLYKKWSEEEIKSGKYGRYIDIKSLYPTVQYLDYLPYGKPKKYLFNEGDSVDINKYFGFVECDVTPPNNLLIPLIGGKSNGKFCFGLDKMVKCVIPTVELIKSLELGYKIDRVYEIYHFKKTKNLFKSYIKTFMKLKEENGGFEGTDSEKIEYCKMWKDKMDIDIEPQNLCSNPGRKANAKLLLNSLWGKFGQRQMATDTYIEDPSKWYKLLQREERGEITIDAREELGDSLFITYKELKDTKTSLRKTNVAICAMITSNARLRLYDVIGKLGQRLLYCDTDSCIYEFDKNKWNPKEGDLLGEWEAEFKEPMREFVAPAPKTYAYEKVSGKGDIKSKGIQFSEENSKAVNLKEYKKLIDTQEKIKAKALVFRKTTNGMICQSNPKDLSFNTKSFKRIVNLEDYSTVPFGYESN